MLPGGGRQTSRIRLCNRRNHILNEKVGYAVTLVFANRLQTVPKRVLYWVLKARGNVTSPALGDEYC